jgi:hypothetical protein
MPVLLRLVPDLIETMAMRVAVLGGPEMEAVIASLAQ